jgi:hypothetical protein
MSAFSRPPLPSNTVSLLCTSSARTISDWRTTRHTRPAGLCSSSTRCTLGATYRRLSNGVQQRLVAGRAPHGGHVLEARNNATQAFAVGTRLAHFGHLRPPLRDRRHALAPLDVTSIAGSTKNTLSLFTSLINARRMARDATMPAQAVNTSKTGAHRGRSWQGVGFG